MGGTNTVALASVFSDPDGDSLTLSALSSDTAKATVAISSTTLTLTGVAAGTATITVTANDGNLSVTDTFVVTVTPQPIPNRAPVVASPIADQSLTTGGTTTVALASVFSDPDGDSLTLSALSSDTAKATVAISSTTLTLTGVAAGTATITVTANDGNLSVTDTFVVTVTPQPIPNRAPVVASPIADQSLTTGGTTTVALASVFSDPDGDSLTLSTSSDSTANATVAISGTTLTISGAAEGTATITVTASDGSLSVEDTFVVTVSAANQAPTVANAIADQSVTVGETNTVPLASVFSDPDGDSLTLSASSSDIAKATVSISGATLTLTAVTSGSATVTVTASDGSLSVADTFTVTVSAASVPDTGVGMGPWLGRFGRTVAEQVLDGVRARRDSAPGEVVNLAGHSFALSAASPDAEYARSQWLARTSRALTAREALLGASFALTGDTDGGGGTFALWGRGAGSGFEGRQGTLTLDGEVTTGLLGADYRRANWLAGLVVSHSGGEGGYADAAAGPGTLDSSLTAATLYGAMNPSPRMALWGAAGHGLGEFTRTSSTGPRAKADLDWTMAAGGARGVFVEPGGGGGPMLAVVTDALWARTASDAAKDGGLAAGQADVTRLRLGVEGGWAVPLGGGGGLTPAIELGLRHDDGDAEAGFGVEIGGGFTWSAPASGLSLDVSGRTLLAHEDNDFEDWGVSAAVAFDPNPASERGLSLTLRHELGGSAKGGLDALFAAESLRPRAGAEAAGVWTAEAAWGFPAFGGRFTGSPHAGWGLTDTARDATLGWRLARAGPGAPDLALDLTATRRESEDAASEHRIGIEATMRW